jgi:hypothetical protein
MNNPTIRLTKRRPQPTPMPALAPTDNCEASEGELPAGELAAGIRYVKVGVAATPPAAIIDVGSALASVVGAADETGERDEGNDGVAVSIGIAYIVVNGTALVGATILLGLMVLEVDILHRRGEDVLQ